MHVIRLKITVVYTELVVGTFCITSSDTLTCPICLAISSKIIEERCELVTPSPKPCISINETPTGENVSDFILNGSISFSPSICRKVKKNRFYFAFKASDLLKKRSQVLICATHALLFYTL